MPSLPISTDFTGSGVTEAGFKTAITNQREFLAGLLGTSGNKIDALIALGVLGSDTVSKTTAYTVIATDRGKAILCSGTFTLSLTAAATLGDGFTLIVKNTGSGAITIDPNSTELIDGASTKVIAAGDWAVITCTGTAFVTFGYETPIIPNAGFTFGTPVATTSGSAIDFTGITSTAKMIVVHAIGISFTGFTDVTSFRVGTGGTPKTTGYVSSLSTISTTANTTTSSKSTTGFDFGGPGADTGTVSIVLVLTLVDSSTNTWSAYGLGTSGNPAKNMQNLYGYVSLSGSLDMVRLYGGTFDAGKANIMYI